MQKENDDEVQVVLTWRLAIRGINYWKKCYPIMVCEPNSWAEYEQFMGRSNRDFSGSGVYRGAIIVDGQAPTQESFEKLLKFQK